MGKSKLKDEKLVQKKKKEQKIKIALSILAGLTLVLVLYYGVYYFILEQSNYFIDHFVSSIIMILIGGCAILLPTLNGQKLTGENKGDNMMLVVGVLLFICALVSIIISYM